MAVAYIEMRNWKVAEIEIYENLGGALVALICL